MSLPDVKDIHGFDLSDRAKHSWYLAMAVSLVLERTIQTSKEEVAELKEALSFIKPAARGVESVHSRIDHKHFKVDNDYELTFEEATREYYDRLNTQGGHIHAKLLDANRTIAELDKPMRQLHDDLIAFANSPKDRQREMMEQDLVSHLLFRFVGHLLISLTTFIQLHKCSGHVCLLPVSFIKSIRYAHLNVHTTVPPPMSARLAVSTMLFALLLLMSSRLYTVYPGYLLS